MPDPAIDRLKQPETCNNLVVAGAHDNVADDGTAKAVVEHVIAATGVY